jgi:hypothetical protein
VHFPAERLDSYKRKQMVTEGRDFAASLVRVEVS